MYVVVPLVSLVTFMSVVVSSALDGVFGVLLLRGGCSLAAFSFLVLTLVMSSSISSLLLFYFRNLVVSGPRQ